MRAKTLLLNKQNKKKHEVEVEEHEIVIELMRLYCGENVKLPPGKLALDQTLTAPCLLYPKAKGMKKYDLFDCPPRFLLKGYMQDALQGVRLDFIFGDFHSPTLVVEDVYSCIMLALWKSWQSDKPLAVCAKCGTTIEVNRPKKQTCSERCRNTLKKQRQRANKKQYTRRRRKKQGIVANMLDT